jgi:fatty acid synthase subunit beta
VYRDEEPVIEATSSFLYRGRFSGYANTFELIEESDYLVQLESSVDVGVLQSKEWFHWEDPTNPLLPGTSLIFKTTSELTYKDKNSFSAISVTGGVYVKNQLKVLKKVAAVDSQVKDANGNIVLGYLQRHGQPLELPILFESGEYTLYVVGISYQYHGSAHKRALF